MRLMLDTGNLDSIKNYLQYFNVAGVTTNPSILKKKSKQELTETLTKIQNILPRETTLHVQVVAIDSEGICQDAYKIRETFGDDVCIKIPVTKDGLKAIKKLKEDNYRVTATAVYSSVQALLAINLGVDFIALYINRMQNINIDGIKVTESIHQYIKTNKLETQILGASFKNIEQVTQTVLAGADYVTVGEDVLDQMLDQYIANKASQEFLSDWKKQFETENF